MVKFADVQQLRFQAKFDKDKIENQQKNYKREFVDHQLSFEGQLN